MKKVNNKGFMLLETLVVSAFVITILIYLYVQFVNLKNGYDKSLKYDSVTNIYSLKQVDEFINKQYGYGDLEDKIKKSEDNYIELYHNSCELEYFSDNNSYCNKLMSDLNLKTLLMINNNLAEIKTNFKEHNPYSNGLLKYMNSIDPVLATKSYFLIAEFKDNTYGMLRLDDINVVVTFDANGGTVKEKTKNVTPGQPYGTLPTPTREGYTFKGWNGKNKFDINNIPYSDKATFNGNKIYLDGSSIENNVGSSFIISKIKNGENWLVEGLSVANFNIERKVHTITVDNSYDNFRFRLNTSKGDPKFIPNLTLSTNKTYTISYYVDSADSSHAKAVISNFQVEEGETATEYEPYYLTSDTKVVQEDNHTLKAIWEKNN